MMKKILIVDDEKYERVLVERCVDWEKNGFRITGSVPNAAGALESMQKERPDLIFCDIRMPGTDGLKLCARIRELDPGIRLVLLTGYRDFEYAREAVHIGVNEYLLKPIRPEELLQTAKRLCENAEKAGETKGSRTIVQDAQAFIQEHFTQPQLSLGMIASSIYTSESYLSRIFREQTGKTITQYINEMRMRRAKELLKDPSLRVYEVSLAVGMRDAHYFGTCFKKYTGMGVHEYRREVLMKTEKKKE